MTNSWLKSYLTRRKQFVESNQINGRRQNKYISSSKEVKHGVLQDSVLGPLLFLLYINDLPLNVPGAELVLFVDDTNLLVTGK
jgi:hypothetical protein